jgi:nitrogen fixation NifU-like protein
MKLSDCWLLTTGYCLSATPHIMKRMSVNEILKERLRRIYSETTVEHILNPRNADSIPSPDGFAEVQSGHNESLKIWLRVQDTIVTKSGFWTNGCAATIACASMSTELVKGKTVKDALAITSRDIANALIDLPEGNLHCADLAAGTLKAALADCLSTQHQPWKKIYRK